VATENDLIQELNFLSDKLSERTRVISAGVIAIWWATIVGDKSPPALDRNTLLGPVIAAGIALFLDVLQYVAGYWLNWLALRGLTQSGAKEFEYDTGNPLYKLRQVLFIAKQIAAIISICWLIVIVFRKFWL